ncbi:MAG TPA: ArsA family ATPase [Thermoleophilaceae bacterium]|nr:ArsA family ATPase [Thermoleophilaceae bacterium]
MAFLLDKRLVFVTGKGGVGKTTVAECLARVAARRGKRVIVCEVAAEATWHDEVEVAPGIHSIAIDPEQAMREYLTDQVGGALSKVMTSSRIFMYLAAAAPGLRELLMIGKVWDLAQLDQRRTGSTPYDLVILDAPATGHALGMLRTPRTFRDVARVGPISRQAGRIDTFLTNPELTGIVAVAAPEEMPVNETIDFISALDDEMHMKPDAVVVNGVYPDRFRDDEIAAVEAVDSGSPVLRAAVATHRRARHHRNQVRRLRRRAPAITLPFLFESELDDSALASLADALERRLG